MTTHELVVGLLLTTAVLGGGAGITAARRPFAPDRRPVTGGGTSAAEVANSTSDSAGPGAWWQRAPFRRDRRVPSLTYDARTAVAPASQMVPEAVPRPRLVLRGLVWGDEPAAVVEGLPGSEGPRLVRKGDTAGPLRVRAISPQFVTITGLDTTWRLNFSQVDR